MSLASTSSNTIPPGGIEAKGSRHIVFGYRHFENLRLIEAIQHEGDTFEVPASLLGSGEHYALRVEGDSMINAGIHDDDVVIIRRTPQAPDGRIVVALVDGQEVTLKRLYRREGKIILEPENDAYKPRVLTPDRVQIQGELSSLIRTYH